MKKLLLSLLVTLAISNVWAWEPDSIGKNISDLDSLIQMVETNYTGFPIIIQKGIHREDRHTTGGVRILLLVLQSV